MNWPLSQDYNEAIQNPASCFADPDLKSGEVPTGPIGIPVPRSGNFADVYQVKGGDGSVWAVKCFTRKVTGLRERYALIDEHLRSQNLPFTVAFTYQEEGIRVKGAWFPIVKMEWVEGFTLNEFVRDNLDKPQVLQSLLTIWCRLAKRLREAEVAHADLQHGNVLLVPGFSAAKLGLKLIDYDGMWIPALAGRNSGEVGHASYQHPLRITNRVFGPDVDRFPHLVIAAGLRAAILGGSDLWAQFDNGDNLLFREEDFREPAQSALFKRLSEFKDPALNVLIAHMAINAKKPLDKTPWLDQILPEDKPPLLTPIQEKEAALALGYPLQKKGTETAKALGTAPAKALQADGWNQDKSASRPAATSNLDFAALTSKPGDSVRRKGSKLPMIAGGLVALICMAVAGVVLSGRRHKEVAATDHNQDKKELVEPKKDGDDPKKDTVVPVKKDESPKDKVDPPKKDNGPVNANLFDITVARKLNWKARVFRPLSDGSIAYIAVGDPSSLQIVEDFKEETPRTIKLPEGKTFFSFEFSFDRRRLALADMEGGVYLVDPANGEVLRTISAGTKSVRGLAFTGDNDFLAFGNRDTDQMQLLECETGKVSSHTMKFPDDPQPTGIFWISSAPLSQNFLIRMQKSVFFWNWRNRDYIWYKHTVPIGDVAISDNGAVRYYRIVNANRSGTDGTVNFADGSPTVHLDNPPTNLFHARFDKSGDYLYALSGDRLMMYGTRDGKFVAEQSVGYVPTNMERMGSQLVTKSPEGMLTVFDIKPKSTAVSADTVEFKKLQSFPAEASWNCLDFNAASTELCFGSNNGTSIRNYNLTEKKMGLEWETGKVFSLRKGADGSTLAQTSATIGKIWDKKGQNPELLTFSNDICGLVRPKNDLVLAGSLKGTVYVQGVGKNTSSSVESNHKPDTKIRCIDVTPSGLASVTIDDKGEIVVVARYSPTSVYKLSDETRNSMKVHISPDGLLVLGYGLEEEVRVWNVIKNKLRYSLKGHVGEIVDAKFTPDKKYIVTAGKDKTIRLWDVATGLETQKLTVADAPQALAVSRNSHLLAVAEGEGPKGLISVWQIPGAETSVMVSRLPATDAVMAKINGVGPGPAPADDGPKLPANIGRVFTTKLEIDAPPCIGYTGDSRKFVVVHKSGTVTIYDSDSMKAVSKIETDKECTAAAVLGDYVFTASVENKLRYWEISTQKLVKEYEPAKSAIRGIYPTTDRTVIMVRDDAGFASYPMGTSQGKIRTYVMTTTYATDPNKFLIAPSTHRAYGVDGSIMGSWNADDGSASRILSSFPGFVYGFAISPGGTKLAASGSRSITLTTSTGSGIGRPLTLPGNELQVHGLQFTDAGRKLVGICYKAGVCLWDATGKKLPPEQILPAEYTFLTHSAASPDGRYYAVVGTMKTSDINRSTNQLSVFRLVEDKKKP